MGLLRALKRNPLECWTQQHFDEPIVEGGLPIGHVVAVHEPNAIRHILPDNAANYRKDTFQQRILSAGLADGLLGVEGGRWRTQRRILAPLFSLSTVRGFARPMINAAEAAINHWPSGARGATIDAAAEMTRITLGVLERTIFSDGLGRDTRANILTFISAGHETTANALTWTLFLLSQSPQWFARVAAEIEREFRGPATAIAGNLVETRAVVEEALRLYPPIAAISRVAIGPDQIDGVEIRRGTLVVISPYVLHRHRLLWDSPDAFDPSRFLGDTTRRINRFAYLPFGAGPRTCIGSAFALQEAVLILAVIMKRFAFSLVRGHSVWPVLRVTLRPDGGLPMRIHRKDLRRAA